METGIFQALEAGGAVKGGNSQRVFLNTFIKHKLELYVKEEKLLNNLGRREL